MRRLKMLGGVMAVAWFVVPVAPAIAQQWSWPEEPENLQVLEGFGGQRLGNVMRGFTRALGVRCVYCHVAEDGQSLSEYDFVSDEKPTKETARTMYTLLGDINDTLDTIEPSGDQPVNMWCHTCHRGRPRPMTIEEELGETFRENGLDAALAQYDELRENFYGQGAYNFDENGLNSFGYEVLGAGDIDGAILVFEKNIEMFPESSNLYDSLAEGYMERGDTELAITNYEKSLELNPQNRNAGAKLKELRGED